jgi:hypothetical protein
MVKMVGQIKKLLQDLAVWFFGLFSQLADYFGTTETRAVAAENVVTINTRQHWDETFLQAEKEGKEARLSTMLLLGPLAMLDML